MANEESERKTASSSGMDPELLAQHNIRRNSFIEYHTDDVQQERYHRKLRIKSMKRPHLSKETLYQMYGAHRYKTSSAESEFDTRATCRRHIGPTTSFGDGNGSFWDRWLVKEPPPKSSFANGDAYPLRGYKRLHPKRYQVYEQAPHDPNGQHRVHDLDELVAMYPDNPLSAMLTKQSVTSKADIREDDNSASASAKLRPDAKSKLKSTPQRHGNMPAPQHSPGRKSLLTEAATAALLKFEERVKRSTKTLSAECTLEEPDICLLAP